MFLRAALLETEIVGAPDWYCTTKVIITDAAVTYGDVLVVVVIWLPAESKNRKSGALTSGKV